MEISHMTTMRLYIIHSAYTFFRSTM